MENKSFGEICYEGYFNKCNGKSLISGVNLPVWEKQQEDIKEAWEEAGNNLIKYYEEFILDNFLNNVKPIEK